MRTFFCGSAARLALMMLLLGASFSQTKPHRPSSQTSTLLSLRGGGDALSTLNDFYKSSPFLAAGITCGLKASAADALAQSRQAFQIQRNVAFLAYGALYQGMAQEYIYNHCYPQWFGTDTNPTTVLTKVAFDLGVQTTLVTLPLAYFFQALLKRQSVSQAWQHYWKDVQQQGLWTKYWLLWGPVQCLTFTIVPEHLRVSFIAAVSFFWLILLSALSSSSSSS